VATRKDTLKGTSIMKALILSVLLFGLYESGFCQDTTLAPTPPMGWNSWNHFAERVTDADVRATADALVSTGMRDAGYIYVNIDDTWEGERDSKGYIHSNKKFPDMKALADYVHSKGLKLGIYSSPGPKTCAGYEGSFGHETQDAETYAKWGIDYLKYDDCSFSETLIKESHTAMGQDFEYDGHVSYTTISKEKSKFDFKRAQEVQIAAYEKMHKALLASGRPIVFSLCQGGFFNTWEWGPKVGASLWRTTWDISDNYYSMSVLGFGQAGLSKYAGPGHWNDPDMLEVGNGGMNANEYRTHMTLWAMLAAPLLAGNDLTKMSPQTLATLTNREVIAVDQDKLGAQGDRVSAVGPMEIWAKPLSNGSKAVALFNRGEWARPMTIKLRDVGFEHGAKLRDLWNGEDVTSQDGNYTTLVPPHGAVLLRGASSTAAHPLD
jgi:alpha-galactosidase